jgi:ABC-type nitrate/sulfonate/bicarbonate transport system substrate-binding protein
MAVCLVLVAAQPSAALDQVSMQLKWKHQFQFAGYYSALEQGFYRAAGLDVAIREGGPSIDVAETVASGKADFGTCNTNVLREWTVGRRLVVLAAIFQHSPATILVPRRGIEYDHLFMGTANNSFSVPARCRRGRESNQSNR